jgi:hypothetical protein
MRERINPRQFALNVLGKLPPEASLEDIREQFDLILGLLEGIRDTEEGRTIPHAQMMAELQEWISKSAGRSQPATI